MIFGNHCPLVRPVTQPWLPRGMSFLSGLPEAARRRRLLMPMQAFVDDSGTKGDTRHFVLAGLISHAESWASFSDEWQACLDDYPHIKVFKMREAAKKSGQFYYMSAGCRDEMLLRLARIINKHVLIVTHSIIDLAAHSRTWGAQLPKPLDDPYFYPFHNTIMATCFALWDAGWRERFEIVFDEQHISGLRAKKWYPAVRETIEFKYPDEAKILPIEPIFKKDDEFLPIQAADMFAWCFRRATDLGHECGFEWLLDEMRNVHTTDYSQYYDEERMNNVLRESKGVLARGLPPEFFARLKNSISQE